MGATKYADLVLNKAVFPVNGDEYLITAQDLGSAQTTIAFYAQQLINTGNPTPIKTNSFSVTTNTHIQSLVLNGVTLSNSNNFILYGTVNGSNDLLIYSDAARTVLVAESLAMSGDDWCIITAVGGSGISGTLFCDSSSATGTFTIQYDIFTVPYSYGIPDMRIFNNRCYVFHQSGNFVFEWDAVNSFMQARPLGLPLATIDGLYNTGASGSGMPVNGSFYYGIELVRQNNGVDVIASTPNRKFANGIIPSITPINGYVTIAVAGETILSQQWTHLRLWRSKNTIPDFSNPLFPINAQGEIDQLYEVALITRAEACAFSVTAIATGPLLPAGNVGITAGCAGTPDIVIIDTNPDSVLSSVVNLDEIELVPIPGCRTGEVNNGTIFAAGIGTPNLAPNGQMNSPVIAEDILYTTNAFTNYQEQWDPQAFLNAGRDGKKTTCLINLMQNLIVIRENSTQMVQQGNINNGLTMIDQKIGIPTFRMGAYIPGLGICAICSDGYFRYLSINLVWMQTLGGGMASLGGLPTMGMVEVSNSIYDLTSIAFSSGQADFAYLNGKLIINLISQSLIVLHMKYGKGWTQYAYIRNLEMMTNFGSGQRLIAAGYAGYAIEYEVNGTITDQDPEAIAADQAITGTFETYPFTSQGYLLEVSRYSFWGLLAAQPAITAKSSGQTWVVSGSFQDPGLYAFNTALNEREYRFEVETKTVGPFQFVPLRGQFISFLLSVSGQSMISWQRVEGRIRQTNGNMGVLPSGIIKAGPGWANQDLMLLNLDDPGTTFYDASGKGVNHTYTANSGSKVNRVSQLPGFGLTLAGGAYINNPTDPVSAMISGNSLVWKAVFKLSGGGNWVCEGMNGSNSWQIFINSGGFTFLFNNGTSTTGWQWIGAITSGIVYAMTFTLSSGFIGQLYLDDTAASSFAGPRNPVAITSSLTVSIGGHTLKPLATTSYYEVENTDFGAEQAQRFWGIIKAY